MRAADHVHAQVADKYRICLRNRRFIAGRSYAGGKLENENAPDDSHFTAGLADGDLPIPGGEHPLYPLRQSHFDPGLYITG